jgi:hypothetical protein
MIGGINQHKPVIPLEKGADKQTVKTAKSSASTLAAGNRSAVSLAAVVGLPGDKLSNSIISFARFFSLPLKPNMLAAIRRQALMPINNKPIITSSPNQAGAAANINTDLSAVFKTREALSLAAAAAESKGVELQSKGLESYAEAVDPELHKKKETDDQRGRKNRFQNDNDEKQLKKAGSITAAEIKNMANESVSNDPLLEILNRLSGKNGQRWIVMPFCFTEDEVEYKVSMRILLEDECRAVRMAIQIEQGTINNEQMTNEGGWVFVFDYVNDKAIRVTVCLKKTRTQFSVHDPKESFFKFKNELSKSLQIPVKNISVKYSDESFPLETSWGDESITWVNEVM